MNLSGKQQVIFDHIKAHGSITKAEAVELVGGNIYHNKGHYVGQTLKRMVDRGIIERESRGVYVRSNTDSNGKQTAPKPPCTFNGETDTPVYACQYTPRGRDRTEPCIVCRHNK